MQGTTLSLSVSPRNTQRCKKNEAQNSWNDTRSRKSSQQIWERYFHQRRSEGEEYFCHCSQPCCSDYSRAIRCSRTFCLCPLCKSEPHTTTHLFNCTHITTQLHVTNLWTAPVEMGHLLVEWRGSTSQLAGPDSG